MTTKNLEQFDQLKANVTLFVAPITGLLVKDFKSASEAVDAGKTIKAYMNDLEKKRKELVAPLNHQVDTINDYAKGIKEPLLKAEAHIKSQICKFDAEQERLRQEEHRKAEAVRREAERLAQVERDRVARELDEKRRAEIAAIEAEHAEAESDFGAADPEALEAEKRRIDEESARAQAEAEARLERERVAAAADQKERAYSIDRIGVKNVRKTWKCEVTDIDKVPKEFLVRELNNTAVLAAARAGVKEIPGVRMWQESGVAFGRNTYVPREALESEETG